MGAFTMQSLKVLALVLLVGGVAIAQSPPLGVGRPATPEEIRAWDISISPTGTELPPGHGSAKEGAQVYRAKGCAGCHGANLTGGRAPVLVKADKPARHRPLGVGTSTPLARTVRNDCLGLPQSRHAPQQRGDAHGG